MSWRETLGINHLTENPYTHNPHNTQKTPKPGNFADSADSAEDDSKLLEALSSACRSLPITPVEVRDALAPEDIEDWRKGDITDDHLAAFAQSLVQRREMKQGKVPTHYTERALCKHCGPIWLWFSGEVEGCPWCWNRATGHPIPRPHSVCCSGCSHFQRIDHPNLGHCAKGEPEAIAGLWDTDRRYCKMYLPKPTVTNQDTNRKPRLNLNQKESNHASD
jgi:hypothetical protein